MKFEVKIDIMPLKELPDPQGHAVMSGLGHLNLSEIADVRIGKHISLSVTSESEDKARKKVEAACKNLLANPLTESYSYEMKQAD